jgi:hypothetical protein
MLSGIIAKPGVIIIYPPLHSCSEVQDFAEESPKPAPLAKANVPSKEA